MSENIDTEMMALLQRMSELPQPWPIVLAKLGKFSLEMVTQNSDLLAAYHNVTDRLPGGDRFTIAKVLLCALGNWTLVASLPAKAPADVPTTAGDEGGA